MSIPCGSRSHSRSQSPQAMASSPPAEVPEEAIPDTAEEPPPEEPDDRWYNDIFWIEFPGGYWLQLPELPTGQSTQDMDQLWINWFTEHQEQSGVANTMDTVRRQPSLFEHALRRSMSSWHYDYLQPRLITLWRFLNEPAPRSLLSWHHPELQQGPIHSMREAGSRASQPIFFVINYFNLTEAWRRTSDDIMSAQPPEIAR